MPFNHLFLCRPFCPESFPVSSSFSVSWLFASDGQSIGASASVLPMNIQDWLPLELTGLTSLQSEALSRVFSSTTIWKHHSLVLSLLYGPTPMSVHDYLEKHSFYYMDLCQQSDVSALNMLSRFIIPFLPRSKCLLILWLQSLSAVIWECKKIKSLTVSIVSPSVCHEVMGQDAMTLFCECWVLSQVFHPPLSSSSRGFLGPLHFLP